MTQAAVSVLLLVMASLFARATFQAAAIDVGFDAAGLYTVSAGFGYGDESGARERSFWARAVSDLQGVPGELLDPAGHRVAMGRPPAQGLQDQKVQCALQQVN